VIHAAEMQNVMYIHNTNASLLSKCND